MNKLIDSQIVLTFDLEDWFHSLDYFPSNWDNYERRIEYCTNKILNFLSENKSTATFFILGDVAQKHPRLVKQIYNEGHEIGSHGFYHRFIYQQSRSEFRDDLKKSISLLNDLIGKNVVSFRAPYFSITKNCLWAFDILNEEGVKYDSSIFPVLNHRYGIPDYKRFPFRLENGLWEWPITTYETFLGNIPFSGGIYFRFLPLSISSFLISSSLKKREPIMLYFHPWEFDPDQPKKKDISRFLGLRHYFGLNNNFIKFSTTVRKLNTISLSQGIKEITEKNK